ETLYRAVEVARRGKLVTFGVTPTRAATGYGYVERGAGISGVRSAYEVIRFHEKPNLETAQEYLKDERFYWNSGMFVWRAQDVLQAAEQFSPRHFQAIAPLGALFGTSKFDEALGAAYEPLEKISIDYAVMEKAPNIATVEADFEWNDIGSPVALRFCVDADADGNIRKGLTEAFDSSGCILLSSEDHLLAAVGCEDLVVIHTPDATLVCPAERAQDIKKLVTEMGNNPDFGKYL
ncbi:MAG: mannose-1-phosphate guanylyltransferase, partial [Planctomycetes bacterium]|nr:mannose-1-phosphate guanylyltransferase [Planctomycetota bacterium]